MKNFVQDDDIIELPAPYAVFTGGGMLVGVIFGVAQTTAAIGVGVNVARDGVFTLPKAAVALTLGQKAYWDDAAKLVTNVVGANTLIGAFQYAQIAGDATAIVVLNGTVS